MTKVYIAYSVHGTNCFISANREMSEPEFQEMIYGGHGYSVAQSRRPGYCKQTDGVKIHLNWLDDATPDYVLKVFKALKDHGWTVLNQDAFELRHQLAD